MKFLTEFGSCYRATSAALNQEEKVAVHLAALTLPSTRRHPANRMNKLRGGAATSTANYHHWRPGLQAISEDGVVLGWEGENTTEKRPLCEKKAKAKGISATSTSNHHPQRHEVSHSHTDDFRNICSPSVMQAFSSTPFMF